MNKKSRLLFAFFIAVGFFAWQQASATDVTISVRYQDNLLYMGSVPLPGPGTTALSDTDGVSRSVNSQSVLALLSSVDASNESFAISKLKYFSEYSSLYLQCITVADPSAQACENWQYVVDTSSPFVGMDTYILSGGETVYVYFGNSRQVVMDTSSVATGGSLVATAQRYNYQDNTWAILSGVNLGIRSGSAVIMQSPVDSQGVARFTLNTSPGSYTVGIAEDFYFPSFGLSVYTAGGSAPAQTSQEQPRQQEEKPKFDAERAIQFLVSNQSDDGSFGQPMLSDWVAIALASYPGEDAAKERLRAYLLDNPNQGALLTDYERRAMALMALGINPYSGTSVDYIEKIVSFFDGSQFGDTAFLNDDAFALLVLLKAGFKSEDSMIQHALLYLLSHQQADGSFAGSVDMTASAIQTLSLFPQEGLVKDAMGRAVSFLSDNQKTDGSFGNVFSTAWAMQAIAGTGNQKFSWQKNEKAPMDFLVSIQKEDGSIEGVPAESMVWANSYVIPAVAKKPWGAILSSFEKPPASSLEEIERKLQVLSQEVEKVRVQVLALQKHSAFPDQAMPAPLEEKTFAQEDFSNLQIIAPVIKEEQNVFEKFGAAVLFAKDSLDIAALSLAVIGLGLAFVLAGGMPNARIFAKVARTIMQKRSFIKLVHK